jgi:hypothetical protein
VHAFSEKITIVRNIYKRCTIILDSFILIPGVVPYNIHVQKSKEGQTEHNKEEEK